MAYTKLITLALLTATLGLLALSVLNIQQKHNLNVKKSPLPKYPQIQEEKIIEEKIIQEKSTPQDIMDIAATCFNKTGSAACSGNGNCVSDNVCQCSAGYSGTECSKKCSQLEFVSVTFSASGRAIDVVFNAFVNASSIALCSGNQFDMVFTNSSVYGTGASCSFPTLQTMRVNLGSSPSIKPSNFLQFKSGAIKAVGSCGSSLTALKVIAANPSPLVAYASINGPNKLADCSSTTLLLDGSVSSGSGDLKYDWRMLSGNGSNAYSASVDNEIRNLPSNASQVSILSSRLPNGKPMVFQLTITDYLGTTDAKTLMIEKTTVDEPYVYTNRLPRDESPRDAVTRLVATALMSNCTSNSASKTFTYKWTCTSHPNLAFSGASTGVATIPAYSFDVGTKYTFQLETNLVERGVVGGSLGNNTVSYSITGASASVVAGFKTQAAINLISTGTLTLDAGNSRDNNFQDGVNPSATYAWTCCELDSTSGACNTTACTSKFTDIASYTQVKYTKAGSLPQGNWKFTVTYSAGGNAASADTQVTVVAPASPLLLATVSQDSCLRSTVSVTTQNIASPVTFTTSVMEGSVSVLSTVTSGGNASMILDTSNTNSRTVLKVTGTSNGVSASQNVVLQPAEKPSGGTVTVNSVATGADLTATTLAGDVTYNLVVKDFEVSSALPVSSSVVVVFRDESGKEVSTLSYTQNEAVRELTTPINQNSKLTGTITVTLRTSAQCSDIVKTVTISVDKYTLPEGQTFENLAAEKANSTLANALASGNIDAVANAATEVLSTLAQSGNSSAGAAQRSALKEQVVNSFASSLLTITEVTAETQAAGVSILSNTVSNPTEVTPAARSNAIKVFETLFSSANTTSSSTGISTTVAASAVNALASLLESFSVGTNNLFSFFSNDIFAATRQELQSVQGVIRGVLKQTLLLQATGAMFQNSGKTLTLSAVKYSSLSVPKTEMNPLPDSSLKVTIPSIPITLPSFVGFYYIKYQGSLFSFAFSGRNLTTDVYGIELTNAASGAGLSVTGADVTFTLSSTTQSSAVNENACRFFNTMTGVFEDITTVSAVAGQSLTCKTTHLTDFAGFNVPVQPQPTVVPTPSPSEAPTTAPTSAPSPVRTIEVSAGVMSKVSTILALFVVVCLYF